MGALITQRRISEIRDLLAYVRVYAPNFPVEDQTTLAAELDELGRRLKEVTAVVQNEASRAWIHLAIGDHDRAVAAYQAGDNDRGGAYLDSVEHFLQCATRGKPPKTTFVAGADGTAQRAD